MAKRRTVQPELPPFNGFPKETFQFLKELASNNDRDWFSENKPQYEKQIVEPALSFIAAMGPKVKKLSPFLDAIPKKTGGSMMRIYRDTRFSKNKQPYKTNIGIHFRHQLVADVHAPGLYVHLEPNDCFLGVGAWMPPSEPLSMIRQYIDEEPREWKKIQRHKAFNATYQMEGESLKTAPKGYPKDHPMIEALRRKSFAGLAPIEQSQLCSSACIDEVTRVFKNGQILMRFLCDALRISY